MKNRFTFPLGRQLLLEALLLGLALLSYSASAQNLLKNGDFESPLPVSNPTAGWAIEYPPTEGGPADWAIAGQTTEARRCCNGRGAHLRPNNSGTVHAYFKQVVTNLTEGASYTLTIQRMRGYFENYLGNGTDGIQRIYMSAVSGSSSNVAFGNSFSNGPYSVTITCDASRQIEVQLHNWKRYMSNEGAEDMKHAKCSAWFDDISLTLTP